MSGSNHPGAVDAAAEQPCCAGKPAGTFGRIRAWARAWPESAGAIAAVVIYIAGIAAEPPRLAAGVFPSRFQAGVSSLAYLVLILGSLRGSSLNLRIAPAENAWFWKKLRRAFFAFLAGFLCFSVLYQLMPEGLPEPGDAGRQEGAGGLAQLVAIGASIGVLVALGILGVAVMRRVRAMASGSRSRALLLDAAAGGLALSVIGVLITSAGFDGVGSLVFLPFFIPLGIWSAVVFISCLALVSLSREQGSNLTEKYLAAAMTMNLVAVGSFVYMVLVPELLPRWPPVVLSAFAMGAMSIREERRRYLNKGVQVAPSNSAVLGAAWPAIIVFGLPVAALIGAWLGVAGGRLLVVAAGTLVVGAIVVCRLILTTAENGKLLRLAESERARFEAAHQRAEELACQAEFEAAVANALLERLTNDREDEQAEIARQLHDDVLQGLSALNLRLRRARLEVSGAFAGGNHLAREIGSLQAQLDAVRAVMERLRPPVLEELGLARAVPEVLEGCAAIGISTAFDACDCAGLDPKQEIALYRIAQEAIRNVAWHSGADSVGVRLAELDGGVLLEVADTGKGFRHPGDLELLQSGRVGLATMRRRAEIAGIELSIRSTPEGGTVIRAWASCEAEVPAESSSSPAA